MIGKLPFILLADGTCLSGDAVFHYIIAPSSPYSYPNQVLLKKPSSLEGEIMAFTSLIRSKLSAAIAYSVWVEDDGYVKIAFPEHSAHWPFPLSWILTGEWCALLYHYHELMLRKCESNLVILTQNENEVR